MCILLLKANASSRSQNLSYVCLFKVEPPEVAGAEVFSFSKMCLYNENFKLASRVSMLNRGTEPHLQNQNMQETKDAMFQI